MAHLPIPLSLFQPGEGAFPPELAGRNLEQGALQDEAAALHERDADGKAHISRNVIIYGPRGNGKTALLLWLKKFAQSAPRGWRVAQVSGGDVGDEEERAADALAPETWRHQVLKGGWGATALGFGLTLPAKAAGWTVPQAMLSLVSGGPALVIVDEAQMLQPGVFRKFLDASQKLRGDGAPLLLVVAGTPDIEDALRRTKASHWERGLRLPLRRLALEAAQDALQKPLLRHNAKIGPEGMAIVMRLALGYPFFLQLLGRHLVAHMNDAGTLLADDQLVLGAARDFQVDQEEFYATRRTEVGEIGGALPAAAAWGAIAGFQGKPSLERVIQAMAPLCGDPWAIWGQLRRLGILWSTGQGVEVGIPSLLDSIVRASGAPAADAYEKGCAMGAEWAQWDSSPASP